MTHCFSQTGYLGIVDSSRGGKDIAIMYYDPSKLRTKEKYELDTFFI